MYQAYILVFIDESLKLKTDVLYVYLCYELGITPIQSGPEMCGKIGKYLGGKPWRNPYWSSVMTRRRTVGCQRWQL